jgi:Transposase DDE domain group 1
MIGDIDLATLEGRPNPRFVTSLRDNQHQARAICEKLYCARGEMENRIKESQSDLFADRTSTRTTRANQLRLWLSSMAYVLLSAPHRIALATLQPRLTQVSNITNLHFDCSISINTLARLAVNFSKLHAQDWMPCHQHVKRCSQMSRVQFVEGADAKAYSPAALRFRMQAGLKPQTTLDRR